MLCAEFLKTNNRTHTVLVCCMQSLPKNEQYFDIKWMKSCFFFCSYGISWFFTCLPFRDKYLKSWKRNQTRITTTIFPWKFTYFIHNKWVECDRYVQLYSTCLIGILIHFGYDSAILKPNVQCLNQTKPIPVHEQPNAILIGIYFKCQQTDSRFRFFRTFVMVTTSSANTFKIRRISFRSF